MVGADIIFQLETNAVVYAYELGSCATKWKTHTLHKRSTFKKQTPCKIQNSKIKMLTSQ